MIGLSARVRQLELRARKSVSHIGAGAYRSAFKGLGIEFQEIREYSPGDDIRTIDWNVTARHGRPYVKRFVEEREQTILLLVDCSASTHFKSKRESIAEIAATLAYAAVLNHDKVGLILFTSTVEAYMPPAGGLNQARRIIRDICASYPRFPGTNIAGALQFLERISPKRTFAFLISDFLAQQPSQQLRTTGRRHNLVALAVNDESEKSLPDGGLIQLEDPESGTRMWLDTSDTKVRTQFAQLSLERDQAWTQALRAADVDRFPITAGEDYFPGLLRFLRAHANSR